jgi:hypothetical protein
VAASHVAASHVAASHLPAVPLAERPLSRRGRSMPAHEAPYGFGARAWPGLALLMVAAMLPSLCLADIDDEKSDERQVVEKRTKISFPRVLTATDALPELRLTGVGVRSKFRFKVYACAHYAASDVELGEDPLHTVSTGEFARRIVMHFVRDVEAKKIVDAYREGFEKNGYDPTSPELAPAVETFLTSFDRDLVKGDVIELTVVPGVGVVTTVSGDESPPIAGARFAEGLWAIWFGDEPVSKGLREDLLELVTSD